MALSKLKRHAEALASFDQVIALRPGFAVAHSNRGIELVNLKRPTDALASCDKASALRPDYAEAHNNRGTALFFLLRPAEAVASHDRAIALKPSLAKAHLHLGNALAALARYEHALASYEQAIALNADYANAHSNRALCLLRLGRFDEGWREYEWRKQCADANSAPTYAQPLWLGDEDIASKALFICWEQGLGDTIQFCRYAELAQARGAKVVMSLQQPLLGLLQQLGPPSRSSAPTRCRPRSTTTARC